MLYHILYNRRKKIGVISLSKPFLVPPKSMISVGIEQVFRWYHRHLTLLGTPKIHDICHCGYIAGFCYDIIKNWVWFNKNWVWFNKTGHDLTKMHMTKHLTSYVTFHLLWGGSATMELAAPLPCCTRATSPIVSLPVWQYYSGYSSWWHVWKRRADKHSWGSIGPTTRLQTGRDICPPKIPAMLKICRCFVARLNDW
jgi:hypothetical protein